ncbi:MAG: CPBP family intramembrane glutamic endopeptidase [Syntrophobacteria bacterium]
MAGRTLIQTPPRATAPEALIILGAVGIFAMQGLLLDAGSIWPLAGLPLLAGAALVMRAVQPLHISLFCSLRVILPCVLPPISSWPLYKVTPLLLYLGIAQAVPCLRRSLLWMRPGRLGGEIRLAILVVVPLSSGALLLWRVIFEPDMSPYVAHMAEMPAWLLPLAGMAFATVNAAVEEAVYRGIFLQALDSAFGAGTAAVVLQGCLFGLVHFSEVGFPKGLSGVVMASVYGLILGFIRRRARGMLAPWLLHLGTDITIFAIVVTSL